MKIDPVVLEIAEGPVTQADIVRIESKLDQALTALRLSTGIRSDKHVLSTAEAMQFVNCRSKSTFDRWIFKFSPMARLSAGRYSRARLEIGRARELNGVKEVAK